MSADTAAERVARGMAVLDERLPGWERRINLGRFDMGIGVYDPTRPTSCGCLLAQLNAEGDRLGDYFGLRDVLLDEDELDAAAWSEDHGFNASGPSSRLRELTRAWSRAINARREAAAP